MSSAMLLFNLYQGEKVAISFEIYRTIDATSPNLAVGNSQNHAVSQSVHSHGTQPHAEVFSFTPLIGRNGRTEKLGGGR